MPRGPRKLSPTGIYHVIIRGVDKMDIFQEVNDRMRFLKTMAKMKKKQEYDLYAYCLMTNHVHFLISESREPLARTMKRICVSYGIYFNKKYQRVGHIFQDRFKSETIDNENYFKNCSRYIHNNPVRAGLCTDPADYHWSSYRSYLQPKGTSLITPGPLLDLFSPDLSQAEKLLREFTNEPETEADIFIDVDVDSMRQAALVTQKHNMEPGEVRRCGDIEKRNQIIGEIAETLTISIRELASILGISKSTLFDVLKNNKNRQ